MSSNSTQDFDEDEGVEIPDEMLKDAKCDPDNPVSINFRDVSAAAYKIKDGIQQTPCTVGLLVPEYMSKVLL